MNKKRLTSSAKQMISGSTWKKIGAMFLGSFGAGGAAAIGGALVPLGSTGKYLVGTTLSAAVAVCCFAYGHENAGAAATLVTGASLLGGVAGLSIVAAKKHL
jgi:hypothetical protein